MDAFKTMLEARSVALVGASERSGSVGQQMVEQLVGGGFDGDLHLVNPNYETVSGFACYDNLSQLPGPVDLAILGVAPPRLETVLQEAATTGVRSVVVFGGSVDPAGRQMMERWTDIVRESGMAMCGANGMGFINFERKLRAVGFHQPFDLEPGETSFLTHSGSAFSAWLHNHRLFRFNLVASTGNELVCTMDRYLDYVAGLESTKVVALMVETIRRPTEFANALQRCARSGIAVVALKVGRTSRGAETVATHSGAIAGDDAAFEAFFDAHGVVRVGNLDELADTVELMAAGRPAAPGRLATIHDSGGERALLVDIAGEVGVELMKVSAMTRTALREVLEPGLEAENPVDAWGSGIDSSEIFANVATALLADQATGALGYGIDMIEVGGEAGYVDVVIEAFQTTDKPVAVLSNFGAGIDPESAAKLRRMGIPVLTGTRSGLIAFKNLFARRDHRPRPVPPPPHPRREVWRERLAGTWSEVDGLSLLADYGVPVVSHREAKNLEDVVKAAGEVGYPVAVKTAAPGVHHKSDVDGVRLGLADEVEIVAAYQDLRERLGPEVVVAAMAPKGVELALGLVNDPLFGPLVVVATGGLLIEVLSDRSVALPPLDRLQANEMIDRLQVRPLLAGLRGATAVDIDAVVDCCLAFSHLACDLGDRIEALDVNPLVVAATGAVAVDALVVPKS